METIVRCVKCHVSNGLKMNYMIAHRDKKGYLVGWIFACVKCSPYLYTAEIKIHTDEEPTPETEAENE